MSVDSKMAEATGFGYQGLLRTGRIPSCKVSREDLIRLHHQLQGKSSEALEKLLNDWSEKPGQSEDLESLKKQARRVGRLVVTIVGSNGEQRISTEANLSSDDLPERISSIVFDSAVGLQIYNIKVPNRLYLELDFTEPPIFYNYNPWDEPSPNKSSFRVEGPDITWVRGVHASILEFFRDRKTLRSWLHTQTAFNLLNYLVGFPIAFWVVYRLSGWIPPGLHAVLLGCAYVYAGLLTLLLFRMAVGFFRWTYPLVELEGARNSRARILISTILATLFLSLLYDVLKTLLWPA